MNIPDAHSGDAPHRNALSWDRVIESIGPESIFVVINRWMGTRLKSYVSVEDIWQEALFHAWRDRDTHEWRDVKSYKNWMLTIIKNRIRDFADQLDSEKRGSKLTLAFSHLAGSADRSLSAILPGRSTTPSVIAAHGERAKRMERALDELPDELESIVQLYLFEELPMEEVARELRIPESTAWYRFRKGARAYAEALSRITGEPRPSYN